MPEEPHPQPSLPFLSVSGDIHTDFDYRRLLPALEALARGEFDAHFVLTLNPPFHPQGDFGIDDGRATISGEKFNYGGIACWHPSLFAGLPVEKKKLFPWADPLVAAGRVSAQFHDGEWDNLGTPQDLARLEARLVSNA